MVSGTEVLLVTEMRVEAEVKLTYSTVQYLWKEKITDKLLSMLLEVKETRTAYF